MAQGLAFALQADEGVTVVGVSARPDEFVAITTTRGPDVAVIHVSSVDQWEVVDAAASAQLSEALVPVVLVTSLPRRALAGIARWSTVRAVIGDGASYEDLVRTIQTVANGGTLLVRTSDGKGSGARRPPSEREIQLIEKLAAGNTNVQIAYALGISSRTVESHMRRLFSRYGVFSRTQLLMLAIRERWTTASEPGERTADD